MASGKKEAALKVQHAISILTREAVPMTLPAAQRALEEIESAMQTHA